MDKEQLKELVETLNELAEADGNLTQKETATFILDYIAQLIY
jgi:uncharacterized tellurite resistance protein B-like protein